MDREDLSDWYKANQQYLTAAVGLVEKRLNGEPAEEAEQNLGHIRSEMDSPPALVVLQKLFGLSEFERDILVLCAGAELNSNFAGKVTQLHDENKLRIRKQPTFGMALALLPDAHWSALTPIAPLRRWRLVELGEGENLTTTPLRLDERILHYLTGVPYLDERLHGLLEILTPPPANELPPSHFNLALRINYLWREAWRETNESPVIQLTGTDSDSKAELAAAAAATLGFRLYSMRASDLPSNTGEREALIKLWEREARLGTSALLLEWDEPENSHPSLAFIETVQDRLFLSSREPLQIMRRSAVQIEVQKPDASEQEDLWKKQLDPLKKELKGPIGAIVQQFNLGAAAIRAAALEVQEVMANDPHRDVGAVMWQSCRRSSRARLNDLAQRIVAKADWRDLVLPDDQLKTLKEMVIQVRQRSKVYREWGFEDKGDRGLGISALFSGYSGTGKTLAAEVISHDLHLDLYRIDLSSVVSKYIGETERNLRRVFEAAEDGSCILLFDEADALFGKRGEVKDSHDRYANIEVSYLLQRMETYRGLAILTTNLKSSLDQAFLRRLRFIVNFPFPGFDQRADIWRKIFPKSVPTENLDHVKLAQLNVTGGNIRNIALNASFLAAEENLNVTMRHMLRAAGSEYSKLEKVLTESEIRGWVEG